MKWNMDIWSTLTQTQVQATLLKDSFQLQWLHNKLMRKKQGIQHMNL